MKISDGNLGEGKRKKIRGERRMRKYERSTRLTVSILPFIPVARVSKVRAINSKPFTGVI